MGFYKDCGGLILFIICYIVFILQFFFIYEITDEIENKQNKFLLFHKMINFIFLFLSVFSHLITSLTDPGSISFENNKEIIEFYYQIHEPFIKRALMITEKKTPEVIRSIILRQNVKHNQQNQENKENNENKENKENEFENEEEEENQSDKDDYDFETKTCINDTTKKKIEEKYHLQLSRCINCFSIRPINSHHCTVCHKCFIEHDHHCPWVNNCIGLFNKKSFILFLVYSFIEVIYSLFLFFYYSLYKNIKQFKDNPQFLFLDVFAMIFGLILAIVSVMLLSDQYDTIKSNCTQVDFKKGILLEKSFFKDQYQIVFGGIYSYKWFLPFYPGGNSDLFKQLCIYLKTRYNKQQKSHINDNKNKDNNGNEKEKLKNQ